MWAAEGAVSAHHATALWFLGTLKAEGGSPMGGVSVGVWCVTYQWQVMGVQALKGMGEEKTLASLLGAWTRLGLHQPYGELEQMQ